MRTITAVLSSRFMCTNNITWSDQTCDTIFAPFIFDLYNLFSQFICRYYILDSIGQILTVYCWNSISIGIEFIWFAFQKFYAFSCSPCVCIHFQSQSCYSEWLISKRLVEKVFFLFALCTCPKNAMKNYCYFSPSRSVNRKSYRIKWNLLTSTLQIQFVSITAMTLR